LLEKAKQDLPTEHCRTVGVRQQQRQVGGRGGGGCVGGVGGRGGLDCAPVI